MNRIALKDLEGEIGKIRLSEGGELDCLWFLCPTCSQTDPHPHSCMMAFSDTGGQRTSAGPTWKKVSGSTVEDLTLSPSFLLKAPLCGLHGWVREGYWVFC
jgi:hypothetical protein